MKATERAWKYLPIVVWFLAGLIAGVNLERVQFNGAVKELNCLHRAADYPVQLSAKFAGDVCAGGPLP